MSTPAALTVHDLSVGAPSGEAPTVLAVHGLTSNALVWQPVARAIAERLGPGAVRILAPDLRGRACSRAVSGPLGLAGHASDLLALAGSLPAPPLLLGHSMGAFASALAAARSPEAVSGAVLVDGGLALDVPPAADVDAALEAIMGPGIRRLSLRFADPQAYEAFWAEHPSMGPLLDGPTAGAARDYLRHDLVPAGDASQDWVSSVSAEAARADGADLLGDREVLGAVATAALAGVPTTFLWAERGMLDEPRGLYDAGRLRDLDPPAAVSVVEVAGVNHFSILFATAGADAVVAAVASLLR